MGSGSPGELLGLMGNARAVTHGEPCLHLHISQREDLMRLFLQQTDSDLLQPSKLRSRTQDLDTWSRLSWGKFYF